MCGHRGTVRPLLQPLQPSICSFEPPRHTGNSGTYQDLPELKALADAASDPLNIRGKTWLAGLATLAPGGASLTAARMNTIARDLTNFATNGISGLGFVQLAGKVQYLLDGANGVRGALSGLAVMQRFNGAAREGAPYNGQVVMPYGPGVSRLLYAADSKSILQTVWREAGTELMNMSRNDRAAVCEALDARFPGADAQSGAGTILGRAIDSMAGNGSQQEKQTTIMLAMGEFLRAPVGPWADDSSPLQGRKLASAQAELPDKAK